MITPEDLRRYMLACIHSHSPQQPETWSMETLADVWHVLPRRYVQFSEWAGRVKGSQQDQEPAEPPSPEAQADANQAFIDALKDKPGVLIEVKDK